MTTDEKFPSRIYCDSYGNQIKPETFMDYPQETFQYMSWAEHNSILREERAKAFEEAIYIIGNMHSSREALRVKAAEIRGKR